MADAHITPPAPEDLSSARAHKRVRWRSPAGKRRPPALDATRNEIVRNLERRHGAIWMQIRRTVSVAGYPLERALSRVRSLRGDGAESLLAMTVALLYLADVRTGFIGKPRPDYGRWHRYTLHDLAQLAYGAQGEADVRRARRSLDMLVSLQWLYPTKQVRRYVDDGTFRSEAAVRRLNLTRICQMAGTTWLLAKDRQHADRTRGDETVSLDARRQRQKLERQQREQEAHAREQQARQRIHGALQSPGQGEDKPATTGDPPGRSGGAAQHIAAIMDLFSKG